MQRIMRLGTLGRMQPSARFDVLVIGSGASGLAAAVAADRAGASVALATKGSIQANNSSNETADPRLVEALVGDAQGAIHWLEELGCAFTRENGGYRLARCGGASRKRLLQVGDRTGHAITKALREAHEGSTASTFPNHALAALEPTGSGWRATFDVKGEDTATIEAGTVVLAAGGRCYAEAERRHE